MKRRTFIAGLGSATAWPVAVLAQQAAIPVIGYLSTQSADDDPKNVTVPFSQGLKEIGYFEGQNVAIEYRYAEHQYDRLAGARSRSRPPPHRGDRSHQHPRSARSQGSNDDHTDRI